MFLVLHFDANVNSTMKGSVIMENWLKFIGVILILSGVIGSLYLFSEIDWDHYDITKKVAKYLRDNLYAQHDLIVERTQIHAQVQLAIIVLFAGLVSGLVLYALAVIIESLRSIDRKLIYSQDASAFLNQ